MYDFPELRDAHDVFWNVLAGRLAAAGLKDVPRALTRGTGPAEVWGDAGLLFAQGCEYPLAKGFADRVRVIAHPVYSAAGCQGARYRSAVIVRGKAGQGVSGVGILGRGHDGVAADGGGGAAPRCDGVDVGREGGGNVGHRGGIDVNGGSAEPDFQALEELRGRRCVVNELDSNSGMNFLRAAVAPLADGGRFFGSIAASGSHLRSARMVASGEADVASIDCVSFAHFQRLYPSLVGELRVLTWTAASPSLPYITAGSASDATVRALRAALADVFDDDSLASVRQQLLLHDLDAEPVEGFGEVLALERGAANSGYPILR